MHSILNLRRFISAGQQRPARDAAGTEGEQLRDQIAEAIAAATGEPADY